MGWSEMTFPLLGGLDIVTPAIRTPPGRCIGGLNYEPIERGYGRLQGHERFDGQPRPSAASYWTLLFDAGQTQITQGQIVTGAISGATGIALFDAAADTGSWAGKDAAGTLVLTEVSGPFTDGEEVHVNAAPVAVANGTSISRGSMDDTTDETWYRAAIDYARARITTVPGSGPVRGVWVYNGDVYAVRDNMDATEGVLHMATGSGWQAQTPGRSLAFTGGTKEIAEGNTITGATSGATAIVKRVIVTSGSWDASDAAGRLVLSGQTGAFRSETLKVGTSSNHATIGGDSEHISLPPGGRYEFVNHNFFGAANLRRMYGVNGVGPAFEWDGETLAPVVTGMTADKPNHIAVFSNHLFLSFPGGSLQNSSIGSPHEWNPVTGALEIGLGEEITGLFGIAKRAMIVGGRNKVAILYGDDANNFTLQHYSNDSGVIEWSMQRIATPVYIDDRGLRSLSTTEAFGDFKMGTVTGTLHPFFPAQRKQGATVRASLRCREKDQYRVFYSDGTGFTTYFGRKYPETLIFNLGVTVSCACSSEESDGSEIMLIGDEDGWVYQLDAGTSFDGREIEAFLRLPFNHNGAPNQINRYHMAKLEMDARPNTSLALVAEFAYGAIDQPPSIEKSFSVSGGGGFWDEDYWQDFHWDAQAEGIAQARIDGRGESISLTVIHRSTYEEPHVLQAATIFYSPHKRNRKGV